MSTPPSSVPSSLPPLHLLLSSLSLSLTDIHPHTAPLLLHILTQSTKQTLQQAQILAKHAERTEINIDDLKLAKLMISAKTKPNLNAREAEKKNLKPLPIITENTSFRLPPESYCIAGATYQLVR
jgi:hypothetical protein